MAIAHLLRTTGILKITVATESNSFDMGTVIMRISAFTLLFFVALSSVLYARNQPSALSVKSVNEQVDGLESRYLEFTNSDVNVRRFTNGNWVLLEETAEGASVSFSHRFMPDVLMDLGVYQSDQLLEELSEQAMRNYVARLKEKYKRSGFMMSGTRALKAPVGAVPFMGSSYWRISYELINASTKQAEVAFIGM